LLPGSPSLVAFSPKVCADRKGDTTPFPFLQADSPPSACVASPTHFWSESTGFRSVRFSPPSFFFFSTVPWPRAKLHGAGLSWPHDHSSDSAIYFTPIRELFAFALAASHDSRVACSSPYLYKAQLDPPPPFGLLSLQMGRPVMVPL